MSARTLTQLIVVVLAAAALALGGVLIMRTGASGASAPGEHRDGGACDLSELPPPLLPSADDTPLLLWPENGARLTLGGKAVASTPEAPVSFPPGPQVVEVTCAGSAPLELRLTLEAFHPGALYAACRDSPMVIAFESTCVGCPPVPTSATAEEQAAARASDLIALRKAAAAAKGTGLADLSRAQEKLQQSEARREANVLMQRWNLLTERYSRAVQVVGRAAPGAVASANSRFEELSKGFATAMNDGDAPGLQGSVSAGQQTLEVFVHAARKARPEDCEFQARLTQSF